MTIVFYTTTSSRTLTFNDTTAKVAMVEWPYVLCACGACLDPENDEGRYICVACGRVWLVETTVREVTP